MGKMFLLGLLAVVMLLAVGCGYDPLDPADPTNAKRTREMAWANIVHYGEGVYYFDSVDANFGNALADFVANHQDLELISVAPNDNKGSGYTTGYFVVFRRREGVSATCNECPPR